MPVFAEPAPSPAPPVKSVVRVNAKTGRLERTMVAPPAPRVAPAQLNAMVDKIANQEGVEAPLVHSVIQAESNYNASAVSLKGAQGIMQLIPSTARRFGVGNAFDAEENIQGGVKYLKFLLDYYQGDYTKAIAAYNAGEAAVDKYHGVPPYAETQGYVRTVAKHLTAERKQQLKAPKPATPAQPDAETPHHPIQASIGADGRVYYSTP
ncbi:MAG TPA: lytic transglycosylase domain-containing protein [Bryobacteraceae bacterium]|nr:lytic transglycosylase domain-containing protein [Bryobacteraceae bacterium]